MKKTILVLSFALAVVSFCHGQTGQTLKIIKDGDPRALNDSTITYYSTPNVEIQSILSIINTGSSSMSIQVRSVQLSVVAGETNAICWGGFCGAPVSTNTSGPAAQTMGQHDTAVDGFNGDYYPNGGLGTTTILYIFYDVNNISYADSITVKYITTNLGVSSISADKIGFSAYPNPAKNTVNFNYNLSASNPQMGDNGGASLKMFNLLGECVQTIPLNTSKNRTSVDVQAMPSGIYICEIEADGYQPAFQKLVVSH